MMHQIRILMNNENVKFTKEVEMDETFIHANTFKRSSARRRYGFDARRTGETVFGIVERGGSVRVWHIDGANATTIMPIIKQHVPKGAIVHTDGWSTYNRLPKIGYQHRWTNHSKLEFYTEHSSTQNIENVWSHFKRGIKGVYRHIGRKYIQAYANEFAWRYNHRNSISSFWALMGEFSLLS
jgi:transposase-like protein